MQVDVSIDEAEVGRVREGQSATFTVDSFPGRTFRGTVGQVRKAALVVQNVVTYMAIISAPNPDLTLLPGTTTNVRITVANRDQVLRVPNAALRYRPPGAATAAKAEKGAAQKSGAAAGGGYVTGLVLAAIGAIIGSILFTKLIKVALAFLVGVLAGAAVYALLGGTAVFTSGQIDMPLVAALLVLLVVFALAYYYIDDLIGVITAAIGGLLLALGIYLLGVTTNVVAALAGLGAFVLGAYVQTKAIRRKRAMRAMAQPPAVAPTPPPPPPPPR